MIKSYREAIEYATEKAKEESEKGPKTRDQITIIPTARVNKNGKLVFFRPAKRKQTTKASSVDEN